VDQQALNPHLSQIATLWSVVCQAHQGTDGAMAEARRQLLERYGNAVYRYLLKALRGADAADDVFQEFALRFVRGDFKRADPERGRFRDFVKTALFHLVVNHHQRQRRRPEPLADDEPGPAVEPPSVSDLDGDFRAGWRDELLARTWAQLAEVERQTGQPFHAVLRFRADHPDLASPQMADALGARLGKPLNAAAVRQTLHRARGRFADLLLDEVLHSLATPTQEELVEELIELGLLEYCRPALERRAAPGPAA
jgi:RNA polymerase sigma-70 factor (ECF subfamily)